jgi:predicted hotdog family 3-hydroxylacyl-ACP dehydratase
LAALRDARLHVAFLDDIELPLQISAKHLFGDGANTVYECRISADDIPIAEGRVTIIQRT